MTNATLAKDALHILTGRVIHIGPAPKYSEDWLTHWRELAQLTHGITAEDPRFDSVMRWLSVSDTAFAIGSWRAFFEAAQEVKAAVNRKYLPRDENRVA
jgi:hypothetical protein